MVRHLAEAIAAAPDATFDAAWLTRTFEAFWADHGAATVAFNNVDLEPLTAAGKLLLLSQMGATTSPIHRHRRSPTRWSRTSPIRAGSPARSSIRWPRALVAERTGHSWCRQFLGGASRVGFGQLRRVFGAGPAHVDVHPRAALHVASRGRVRPER